MGQSRSEETIQPNGRREELINIAEELSAESGPSGLRLREIARHAGIAAPSVYNHFDSLDGLLTAVIDRHFEAGRAVFEAAADKPPIEAMSMVCRSHLKILANNPGATRLILLDLATPNGISAMTRKLSRVSDALQLEEAILRRGIEARVFRRVPAKDVIMARIGISVTLLSDAWFKNKVIGKTELARKGSVVAEFVLRYLERTD